MSSLDRFEWLARLGYGARGVVYLLIGWFAMAAALGSGQPTDTKGALRELLVQPFGRILLAIVALGLVGYALWRFVQGWLDLDGHGSDAKGLAIRGGLLISAAIHVALAFFAVSLVMGWQGPAASNGDGTQDWTAWLLGKPFGRWAVAGVGLGVIGAALGQFVKAWKGTFCRHLATDADADRLILPIGRIGLSARGIVFLLIGIFFLTAAWQADAAESGGLGAALRTIQGQAYGPWLLGLVAAGLFAFGTYGIIQAFYRRINSPAVMARLRAAT